MGMFRLFIRVLPVIYMIFIWWQSGSLNPESLITLAPYLGYTLVSFLGVGLELAHLFEFGLLYYLLRSFFLAMDRSVNGGPSLRWLFHSSTGLSMKCISILFRFARLH